MSDPMVYAQINVDAPAETVVNVDAPAEMTVEVGAPVETVIDVSVTGAPGPQGVVAATPPVQYDAPTQTVSLDVAAIAPSDIGAATSAQGALADTAVQPGDLGSAAYSAASAFVSSSVVFSKGELIVRGNTGITRQPPGTSGSILRTNYAAATGIEWITLTAADVGAVASATVTTIWTGTQAEYDALTPDPDTLYVITG